MNRLARHASDEPTAGPLIEEVQAFEKLSAGAQKCAALQPAGTCPLDLVLLYQVGG
jgi:hypothetical protein